MRSNSPRAALACVIALMLWTAPSAAQDQEPIAGSFSGEIGIEVVDVDVIVTDRAGERILDLARDQFEIRVDGQVVAIDYFVAPRRAAESAPEIVASEPEPAPEPPASLVVYVDQAALMPRQRDRAVEEIRAFVHRKRPLDVVIVAAFEQRLHLIGPPSAELSAIDTSLDQLLRLPVAGALAATQRTQLDNAVRGIGIGWPSDPGRAARLAEAQAMQLEGEIRTWAEKELERQRRSIAALEQLIGVLGTLEGRKSVLLATGGSTTEGAEVLLSLLIVQRFGPNRMPPPFEAKRRVRTAFEEMVRAAQDARVTLYTVSAGDTTMMQNSAELAAPGRDVAPQPRDPAIVDAAGSVGRMAGSTGGRMFVLGSDLDTRLDEVRADLDSAYTIGFRTGAEAGLGDHKIEVRALGKGLRTRHRASFRRRTAAELAEQALLAAASLGQTVNPLGVSLGTGVAKLLEGKRGDRLIPVALRVPIRQLALLPEKELWSGRLTVQIAIQGELGALFLADAVELRIDVPEADREEALAADWVYRADVRVSTQSRRIAVLFLDQIAGIFSTATASTGGPPSP